MRTGRVLIPSRSCRQLVDPDLPEDLRYCRAGQHFVVCLEEPSRLVVVDVLPVSSDLRRRLAPLSGSDEGS